MGTKNLMFSGKEKKDLETFELLFEMHYSKLCGVSNSLVKNPSLAEDIVLEVFKELWDSRESTQVFTDFSDYLFNKVFSKSFTFHLKKNSLIKEKIKEKSLIPNPLEIPHDVYLRVNLS